MKSYLKNLPKGIYIGAMAPFVLTSIGTIGYKLIEGKEWSWFDALYMSAITLTTVGYQEVQPLSSTGRIFTIFFLYLGVFTLFYFAPEIIRSIVNGEFKSHLGRTRMLQKLAQMENHVIICGMGRMGRLICSEFERNSVPFVIIDQNEFRFKTTEFQYGLTLIGDATNDEVLLQAGIKRAKTIVAVLPSDAANLYITLSARLLKDDITIIARAEEESSESKLRRVGANIVISPYLISGYRVSEAVLRPTLGHFLDQTTSRTVSDYQIEEITIEENSPLIGQTLSSAEISKKLGVVIVALKHENASMIFNPSSDTQLYRNTTLVAVGNRKALDELEKLAFQMR